MLKLDFNVIHSMYGRCCIVALLTAALLVLSSVNGSEYDSHIITTQGPSTIFAQRKIPLLLNCSATSTTTSESQNVTAQWFKNGFILVPDRHVQIMENGSLYIRNVKRNKKRKKKGRNDEGFYECHLRNRHGTLISRQVHLKVARIAKSFTTEPQDVETRIGGIARFVCQIEAVPPVPPSMIIWQKDGQQSSLLKDSNRFTTLSFGDLQILQINNVQQEDSGKYHCAVYHQPTINSNPKYSRDAMLTINQSANSNRAPEIVSFSGNTSQVRVGESLTLECFVDGKPKPHITWFRLDKQSRNPSKNFNPVVFDSYKEIVGIGNLKFKEIRHEDDGIYKCVATSPGFSSVEETVIVQVIEPPELLEGPDNGVYPLTRVIRLECSVSGTPKPTITWYFNGKPRPKKKSGRKHQGLVIQDSNIRDSGYYQCIAENVAGSLIATARITVTMTDNVPNPPTDVQATAVSAREISVNWKPSQIVECCKSIWYTVLYQKIGNPDIPEGKFDSKLPTPAEALNITIRNLEPYTSYRIFVRAYNTEGGSEKSNIQIVKTKEWVPSSTPVVTLSNRVPKSIHVHWDWPESMETDKNGIIVEYKIYYKDNGGGLKYLEVPGTSDSYTITNLKPETEYRVCVLGRTSIGYPLLPDKESDWPWATIQTLSAPAYHPNVTFTCINSTTMRLNWWVENDTHPELTSGYQIIMRKIIGQGQSRNISIDRTRKTHLLTNLEEKMHYAIKFLVLSHSKTIGMTEDTIYTDCQTVPRPPPPLEIDAKPLPGNKIHLSWQRPKSHQDIKYYTIKYNKVEDPHRVTYQRSDTLTYDLENLSAMTWYAVSVRSHLSDIAGPFSNTVHVQTKEDVPSPPEHLQVRSEGNSLIINWQPPVTHNGMITYYIVMYNSDKEVPDDKWTYTKVNGSRTMEILENLPKKRVYYFKVKACNRIGESPPSKVIEINICPFDCPPDMSETGDKTNELMSPKDHRLGIIIGCSVGLTSIIICVIIVYLRQRHYSRIYRQQQTQYQNGSFTMVQRNGHVGGQYPSNHTATVTANHRYGDDPNTPMLTENIHSDTKGPGPGVIFSANGKIIYLCNSKTNNGKMRALVAEPEGYSESQEHQALLTSGDKADGSKVLGDLHTKDFSDEISANTSAGSNVSLSCDPSICSSLRPDNHSVDNSPDFSRGKFERGYKFEDRQDSWDEEQDSNIVGETGRATSESAVGPQDNGASGFIINDSGFHKDSCHSDDLNEENADISLTNQELHIKDNDDLLSKMLDATSDYNNDYDTNDDVSNTVSSLTSFNTSAASSSLPQSSLSSSPVATVATLTSTTEASLSDQI